MAAIIALVIVVVFSRKHISVQIQPKRARTSDEYFFDGLHKIHIHHEAMRRIFSALQKHIVGMDYFLH